MVWFYQLTVEFSAASYSKLSIPLWSDFIDEFFVRSVLRKNHFQSHYGLILSEKKKEAPLGIKIPFNPTMVWFYPVNPRPCVKFFKRLSIPLWSDFIPPKNKALIHPGNVFQSHYGLILSRSNFSNSIHTEVPFNPILVWFYQWINGVKTWQLYQAFNPILVWFYRLNNKHTKQCNSDLSIPFWSDFI